MSVVSTKLLFRLADQLGNLRQNVILADDAIEQVRFDAVKPIEIVFCRNNQGGIVHKFIYLTG
jgi:hypothetical protein